MQVSIFIETDNRVQKEHFRRYGYVLASEYKGELITAEGFGPTRDTYHGTILEALREAVSRLKGRCELIVHAQDQYVLNMLTEKMKDWKEADWKGADGKEISHADKWKAISDRLEELGVTEISTAAGHHEYTRWLQSEIDKRIFGDCGKIILQIASGTDGRSAERG